MSDLGRVRIIGPGRAGLSFAGALASVGWAVEVHGRSTPVRDAGADVDLVLICTPDDAIAAVADAIEPTGATVAHVAGSLGLDVLASHPNRAGVHPLISLPDPTIGAARLVSQGWFAVAGDAIAARLVDSLDGHRFVVADEHRAAYHAAACVASNHLVALLGQVERLAEGIGVPAEAYLELAKASLDNVASLGAVAALTGPAARGDERTIDRHLAAMAPEERPAYRALVEEARRLAGHADR